MTVGTAEDSSPVVRLDQLSVGYRGDPVVAGVSLSVDAGGWLTVIGPNGAGKSTLLKAVAGVLGFRGSATVLGVAQGGRVRQARAVAYVPQQPSLPSGLTVAEYVLLGRTAHLGWLRTESAGDRRRVAAVLDQLDLGPVAGRPVTELSGGEAQRATLARALVQEARILVLDEPTSSLDLAHAVAVLELIDELRRHHDLAVITAMHDLTLAGRFADRLVLLVAGRPVASGSPSEVLVESTLAPNYGTPVAVLDGPDGGRVVIPRRVAGGDRLATTTMTTSEEWSDE